MRNFTLIFLFIPVIVAFHDNGGNWTDWALRSLLLLWAAVEILSAMYRRAVAESEAYISMAYFADVHAAMVSKNPDGKDACHLSFHLFNRRGVQA